MLENSKCTAWMVFTVRPQMQWPATSAPNCINMFILGHFGYRCIDYGDPCEWSYIEITTEINLHLNSSSWT